MGILIPTFHSKKQRLMRICLGITNLVVLEPRPQFRSLCFSFLCYTTMSFYLIWILEEVFWDTLNQYFKETIIQSLDQLPPATMSILLKSAICLSMSISYLLTGGGQLIYFSIHPFFHFPFFLPVHIYGTCAMHQTAGEVLKTQDG